MTPPSDLVLIQDYYKNKMKRNEPVLSKRGAKLLENSQPLVEAHFKSESDPWSKNSNPNGYINLGTAENHLVFDLLEPVLNKNPELEALHTHYGPLYGLDSFRHAMAGYLTKMTGAPVKKDQIVTASGSSAIIDMLMYCLCDSGDGVIIPAPYYAGFDHDLKGRSNVEPIPVVLKPENGYKITQEALQETLVQARMRQIKVKALLIASPNNPLGKVYDEDTLKLLLNFATEQKLELISDELYAQSVFGDALYQSFWKLAQESGKSIHLVYGFAKDFGLSGFKTGFLVSNSEKVLHAMRELSYFAPVSNATQKILENLISDKKFMQQFFKENRKRLKHAFEVLSGALNKEEIPLYKASAGFFAWLDLRDYLASEDEDAEMDLYFKLLNEGKVNLSPGQFFHGSEPGYFRLCFARPDEMLKESVKRIASVLKDVPKVDKKIQPKVVKLG